METNAPYTVQEPRLAYSTKKDPVKNCLFCGKELNGRTDKKFCDSYCRSQYHYKQTKENEPGFYIYIDKQLKKNRKILKAFNKAGKATVRESAILKEGFNPRLITHYWRNPKGMLYLFVYEYGFNIQVQHNVRKYVIIKWQKFMKLDLR